MTRIVLFSAENIGEQLAELQEAHGIKGPIRFMYTHLFDPAIIESRPIYGIARDEDHHFWPQWFGRQKNWGSALRLKKPFNDANHLSADLIVR